MADEELRLGRSEEFLVLGIRLRHERFRQFQVLAECGFGNAVAKTEIFFSGKSLCCFGHSLECCLFDLFFGGIKNRTPFRGRFCVGHLSVISRSSVGQRG